MSVYLWLNLRVRTQCGGLAVVLILTPFYPDDQDILNWHQTAYDLCQPFGENVYAEHKQWCDDYFYLKHRDEQRGVGGLFFDDLNQWDFENCFQIYAGRW